jgi:cytochrome c oxidase assembly protein subunit 15
MAGLVFVQIVLGATMRHTGAGLAIPDFPLVYGGVLPPAWTTAIAIHYAHRIGAIVVTALVLANAAYIWSRHGDRPEFVRPLWVLIAAVALQITLGALVVLSGKQPVINTLHVAGGAAVLATSVLLTLRAFRVRFAAAPVAQRDRHAARHLRSAEGT